MNHPNIVFILADDMGYGDVRALNPGCVFPTPNLDRLCGEGLHFTDAHSSSAVCTPSRYSIMTGRYCWRTWLKRNVLQGVGRPLIPPDRLTLAHLCRRAGYRTACIGKWHLGWNWAVKPGMEELVNTEERDGKLQDWIDFTRSITGGPTANGFDRFYGISGSLDMPPFVYVDQEMPVTDPTAWGTPMEFVAEGPRQADLRANFVLGHLTEKAEAYIREQSSDTPFLLYFPITAPHLPIAPAPEFIGRSGVNPYCDFCMEVDYRVGRIMDVLKEQGLDDNTLIVFASDNGVAPGPSEVRILEQRYRHFCSERRRGYKADIWDGGHRVPFLMRWPDGIVSGSRNDQPVGIFDVFATVAEMLGQTLPENAGEDSISLLPALRGEEIDPGQRHGLIHHSFTGRFAVRDGDWKLLRCPGSGGWIFPDEDAREQGYPEIQLYHMATDEGERKNVYRQYPEKVEELTRLLHRALARGRTTDGPRQENEPDLDYENWDGVVWLAELPERFVLDD